jgi:hypothetical protein
MRRSLQDGHQTGDRNVPQQEMIFAFARQRRESDSGRMTKEN